MNARNHPCFFLATFALLALTPADAAIVISTVSTNPAGTSTTTDEVAYAGDVSNTDLLHGIAGSGTSWNQTPQGLNDGLHGGDFTSAGISALNGAAWASDGDNISVREFLLGTGANGLGFDITGIQSIAAWSGSGFANQRYTVSVSHVGDASFSLLTAVNFQPFSDAAAAGGSSKVNITDDSGFLATRIDAIRFSILDTTSLNNGGVVMREIDVIGVPSTVPEPAGLALGCLGALTLLRRRR